MLQNHLYQTLLLCTLFFFAGCQSTTQTDASLPTDAEGFVTIFNGKDLTGWTPKFAGVPLGENYKDTFIIEDGILKVTYDNYETFDGKFGHLFYEKPYSHYVLKMDYRFVEGHCKGAPNYTWINSGVMLHSQSPESMSFTQAFPSSIEAQMLGLPEGSDRKRTTSNVCTPGTHVFFKGELDRRHCISSSSKSFLGDQWITLEMEVHGHDKMIFRVNDENVFELEKPQLDINDKRDDFAAKKLIEARGGEIALSDGYIALQAEGAPVQFRNIRIKPLAP